ncbi:MAG: nucleotide sugar dehydrogenase [Candidatus Dadabacteria bacterium]|nr:MAG: nucleotide sugar dehydrogenase [Candidatus Dadabacteria bacterium]
MTEKIGVIGLGYVGLPLALGFARKFTDTVGFDINEVKVAQLKDGIDVTGEGLEHEIRKSSILFTCNPDDLRGCSVFIVGVPTPVDSDNRPDLSYLRSACQIVGRELTEGGLVVFESTVYPGVTEDYCGPILEETSGLKCGQQFKLGYSPERINPGDHEHTLEKVTKVIAGQDQETTERMARLYGAVVEAGVFKARSIKVAEAAKVIENTQRDLNIALMNELAIIFDRLGISTHDVLDAAATKWNFLRFLPGLVGGHCIGVDPYYLTTKAQQIGYHPEVILAGRKINDSMGVYVAERAVKLMIKEHLTVSDARVGILGLTFKENVADTRNSRVPDIYRELKEFGLSPLVHDPLADPEAALEEYGITLSGLDKFQNLDCLIVAVAHDYYLKNDGELIQSMLSKGAVLVDVKGIFRENKLREEYRYWSL